MSPAYRDDAQELADACNERVEEIVYKFWPGAIRTADRGKPALLLTPRIKKESKQKKPTSSFKVQLDGSNRGKWYRFSEKVGGWGLQLLYYGHNGRLADSKSDWADAYRFAREFLGIVQEREQTDEEKAERKARAESDRVAREQRAAAEAKQAAEKRVARIETAQDIWAASKPLAGTHGDAYLQARGLPPVADWPWDPGETIRFHPALDYELDHNEPRMPAVVALVRDAFGEAIAVWQIYLDRHTPAKADVVNAKVGRGPAGGGAVRIGGDGPRIGIGEGLETCLAAWVLERHRFPVWAGLSTSGLIGFEAPIFIKQVSGYPDGDSGKFTEQGKILDPPGMAAMRKLQQRLIPTGIKFNINDICLDGDMLDLLNTMRRYENRTT